MPKTAVKKEPTASALVFSLFSEGWRICLIMHPRLGMLLPPGGHVEADETSAEAAVRETAEETGLAVRLLPPQSVPVPAGTPHVPVPAPWWILEMRVPAARARSACARGFHLRGGRRFCYGRSGGAPGDVAKRGRGRRASGRGRGHPPTGQGGVREDL